MDQNLHDKVPRYDQIYHDLQENLAPEKKCNPLKPSISSTKGILEREEKQLVDKSLAGQVGERKQVTQYD